MMDVTQAVAFPPKCERCWVGAGEIRGCILKLTNLRRKQCRRGNELVAPGEGESSLEKAHLGWERQKELDIQDATLPFPPSTRKPDCRTEVIKLDLI